MEYNKPIKSLSRGDQIQGFYVLLAANAKTTAAGKPYLNGAVADREGSIDFVAWDYAGGVGAGNVGNVVKLQAEVNEYRGALQLTVYRLRAATAEDRYDAGALVPSAPIDWEAALDRVQKLVGSIEDADYRRLTEALLQRDLEGFRDCPAAKSVHHAFLHGLLMHTAYMLETADFLARQYGSLINRSLLLAGTVLHDLGKTEEFTRSPLGLVTEYSLRGQLLGHLVMGAERVAAAARELGVPEEKSTLLQHLILSHHGEPDFGAAVRPMCAEAELLSCIDLMDSRMEIYRETLAETELGSFSGRVFALDGKMLYRHQ